MGLLDSEGLTYFYNKLKSKFAQSVNGNGPVNGDITLTNVPTADNLTSEEAVPFPDLYRFRTSGGLANIETGEATLMYIEGYSELRGHKEQSIQITNSNNSDIDFSCTNIATFNTVMGNPTTATNYEFSYVSTPFTSSSEITSTWSDDGNWKYNNNIISLDAYGLLATNVIANSITISKTSSTITSVKITPSTFAALNLPNGTYTFLYSDFGSDESHDYGWYFNHGDGSGERVVSMSNYGVAINSGSPSVNDVITVVLVRGSTDTVFTLHYQPYVYGTYVFATPKEFLSTGFNQFNKNGSLILDHATISGGKIVVNDSYTTKACYCLACPGPTLGYIAQSAGGHIQNIGWTTATPANNVAINTTVGPDDLRDTTQSSIIPSPSNEYSYVVVIVDSYDDLCIHTRWDTEEDDAPYEAYQSASKIVLNDLYGKIGSSDQYTILPITQYGMPMVNNITDTLNLPNKTYIQRIKRVPLDSQDATDAINNGYAYEYDDTYMYYVLPTEIEYNSVSHQTGTNPNYTYTEISATYTVNDFGTERYPQTPIILKSCSLYGENLRNKLKGDVVTISTMEDLTTTQINSIRKTFLDIVYPVGSIYMSTSSTNPKNIWGGDWSRITGRFLIGVTDNATNSGTSWAVTQTGGVDEVTLTANQIPAHTHGSAGGSSTLNFRRVGTGTPWVMMLNTPSGIITKSTQNYGSGYVPLGSATRISTSLDSDTYTWKTTHTHTSVGGGKSHTNMPPFYAVYIWRRTA